MFSQTAHTKGHFDVVNNGYKQFMEDSNVFPSSWKLKIPERRVECSCMLKRNAYACHESVNEKSGPAHRTVQLFFSRNGFILIEVNPISKQSSFWCSIMYCLMSWIVWESGTLLTATSLLSCSTTIRWCWSVDILQCLQFLSFNTLRTTQVEADVR